MSIPEPAVSRKALVTTAAALWALVGIFLSIRAAIWLVGAWELHHVWTIVSAVIGIGLGVLKGRWIFARLARRNVSRIRELSPHKEKICIFAFQAFQSYLIVILMVGLGIALRLSPIPRLYLAGLYLLVGTALLIGSISYANAADV